MTKTIHGTTRSPIKLHSAVTFRSHYKSSGALSGEYVNLPSVGEEYYVVRSYAEPIAIYDYISGRLIFSTRKFSVTTSKHQGTARRALAIKASERFETDELLRGDMRAFDSI